MVVSRCSSRRKHVAVVFLSIFVYFLWFRLDANPLLFLYDSYLTLAFSTKFSYHDSNDNDVRRVFHHVPNNTIFGKTIWITGASSGLGAELARQLAFAGVGHLILSGRRRDKLQSVAQSCQHISKMISLNSSDQTKKQPLKISLVPFDLLGNTQALEEAVFRAIQYAGSFGIDVLVLNAGRYQCSPALETDMETALPHLMQVNFISPVLLSQKLIHANRWKERGYGHLVVVSSLMGRGASPLNAPYASTKHALRGYFHSLAAEERKWLKVNVILPGATDTDLWKGSWKSEIFSETRDGLLKDDGNQSKNLIFADKRSKMSVERCAQLMISTMMGPNMLFSETWITRNPGLLWVTLASYEPMTFTILTNFISQLRIELWRSKGEDALYLPTYILHLWECFKKQFREFLR